MDSMDNWVDVLMTMREPAFKVLAYLYGLQKKTPFDIRMIVEGFCETLKTVCEENEEYLKKKQKEEGKR